MRRQMYHNGSSGLNKKKQGAYNAQFRQPRQLSPSSPNPTSQRSSVRSRFEKILMRMPDKGGLSEEKQAIIKNKHVASRDQTKPSKTKKTSEKSHQSKNSAGFSKHTTTSNSISSVRDSDDNDETFQQDVPNDVITISPRKRKQKHKHKHSSPHRKKKCSSPRHKDTKDAGSMTGSPEKKSKHHHKKKEFPKDHEPELIVPSPKKTIIIEGKNTSEKKNNTDKSCSICLTDIDKFTTTGTPTTCKHTFHLNCLMSWCRIDNSCPLCKCRFPSIQSSSDPRPIAVEQKEKQGVHYQDEGFVTIDQYGGCSHCNEDVREDLLLLCDGCEAGWHTYCLDPPLSEVPLDDWWCPDCELARLHADMAEQAEQEKKRKEEHNAKIYRERFGLGSDEEESDDFVDWDEQTPDEEADEENEERKWFFDDEAEEVDDADITSEHTEEEESSDEESSMKISNIHNTEAVATEWNTIAQAIQKDRKKKKKDKKKDKKQKKKKKSKKSRKERHSVNKDSERRRENLQILQQKRLEKKNKDKNEEYDGYKQLVYDKINESSHSSTSSSSNKPINLVNESIEMDEAPKVKRKKRRLLVSSDDEEEEQNPRRIKRKVVVESDDDKVEVIPAPSSMNNFVYRPTSSDNDNLRTPKKRKITNTKLLESPMI